MKKPIRVGMIRLDTHAMYYAPLMQKHDPLLLRDPIAGRDTRLPGCGQVKVKRGWQLGACYFYFYTHYCDAKRIMAPTVSGFEIAKVWDDLDDDVARNFCEVFYGTPKICKTLEEASDDVDLVFIADCTGEGKDHLRLAAPGLKKGVPTFIDKPFAYHVADAKRILRLARKHRAPVMSLSMLRVSPHAARFRNRLAEIAPVEFGTVRGCNEGLGGQIHTISLAQHVFGSGVEAVYCTGPTVKYFMGPVAMAHVLLDYGGKPDRPKAGVMLNNESGGGWHGSLYASAYSRKGAVHSEGIGDFQHPWSAAEILRRIKRMVRTRRPQASHDEMLEGIAIAQAARLAQKTGKRVALKEVLGRKP
ncbi:MAG: Gfo/Idh/MocA family oxidoreductase [Verrucomicrobia bacterium]|nr:Gfo/Idh/MocA family oxidoreductase [Verrucomicrobiota bacterium]